MKSGVLGGVALFVLVLSGAAAQVAIDDSFTSQARLASAIVSGLGTGFGVLLVAVANEEVASNARD